MGRHSTAWACGTLLAVTSLGQTLAKTPLLRILELNICRSYYQRHDLNMIQPDGYVEEQFCKILPIQGKLSSIYGWNVFFQALVEFLIAFPYATLCERFNRRSILFTILISEFAAIAYTSATCYFYQSFDTEMIWVSALFRVCGGGEGVMVPVLNALIAETVDTPNLSKIIFPLNATRLFVHASSQTVGARLMRESLWLPVVSGLLLYSLNLPILLWINDPQYRKSTTDAGDESATEASEPLLGVQADCNDAKLSGNKYVAIVYESIHNAFHIAISLSRSSVAAPCLAIYFFNGLGHGMNNIIEQWVSKVLHWSLMDTNYILSAERVVGGLTLIALFIAVHYMQAKQIPSRKIDLGIIWLSQATTLVGTFGAATSKVTVQFVLSLLVYMTGWGMKGALQSHITQAFPQEHINRLYIGLNVSERAAAIVGGPFFATLLSVGLQWGGLWVYLPYWVSLLIFVGVGILTQRLTSSLAGGMNILLNARSD